MTTRQLCFHVPSKRFVQLVLIGTVTVGILCLWIDFSVPDVEMMARLPFTSWLPIVPVCGIPWLLLAGYRRSHSKEYYIRYRCAQVLVLTTCFFALGFAPFGWTHHTVNPVAEFLGTTLSDNLLMRPISRGIIASAISLPIFAWQSRGISSKETQSKSERSLLREVSMPIVTRFLPVTMLVLIFTGLGYYYIDILGMRSTGYKQRLQDRLVTTKTCIRCLKLTRLCCLENEDLTGAVLTSSRLMGSHMKNSNLTGADLGGADLTQVDLRGANLTRADLTGAELSWTNLRRANLTGADLTQAFFNQTKTKGAIFCRTVMPNGIENNSNC